MREVMQNVRTNYRIQRFALSALQEIFETLLISIFESKSLWTSHVHVVLIFVLVLQLIVIHVKRIIILLKDLQFVQSLNVVDRKSLNRFTYSMNIDISRHLITI